MSEAWAWVRSGVIGWTRWVASLARSHVREMHVYPGVALVGYGTYEWTAWAGYVVWGALLLVIGLRYVKAEGA